MNNIQILSNIKFKKWTTETIDYIITLYEIDQLSNDRVQLYIILNNYIIWLKKNKNYIEQKNINQYSYEKLLKIKNNMKSFIDISPLDNNIDILPLNSNDFENCEVFDYSNHIFNILLLLFIISFIIILYKSIFSNSNNNINIPYHKPHIIDNHTIFPTQNLLNNNLSDIINNPIIKTIINHFL